MVKIEKKTGLYTKSQRSDLSRRRELWPKGLNYVRNYSSVEFMCRGRDLAGISSDINCRDKKRSRSRGSLAIVGPVASSNYA